MICSKCKKVIPNGSVQCPECGADLKSSIQKTKAKTGCMWAFIIAILAFAIISVSSDGIGFFFKILFSGILVGAIVDIRGFLYHFFNEFAVTNKKVVAKTGIIKTTELSSPLKQIQNVQVATGFWGKIFKYGTVNVTTASGLYSIKYVNDPQGFRNSIMAQIENTEEDKMDLHAHKIASAIHNLEN